MTDAAADQGGEVQIARSHPRPPSKGEYMEDLNAILAPGMLVRHPDCDDWGVGQVQSNVGMKVTVNFRDYGKVIIDSSRIALLPVFEP